LRIRPCRRGWGLAGLRGCGTLCSWRWLTGRGRLTRLALMRGGWIGSGLGRCRRARRPAGRFGAVGCGSRLSRRLAVAADVPALRLFDWIGAVVPMAAWRRLPGRCRQAIVFVVLRTPGRSADAGSGKNKQSTQNETRSCFRQFPLAFPSDCFPKHSLTVRQNALAFPSVPQMLKRYCSENMLSHCCRPQFFCCGLVLPLSG
jgi:hypothetical protein